MSHTLFSGTINSKWRTAKCTMEGISKNSVNISDMVLTDLLWDFSLLLMKKCTKTKKQYPDAKKWNTVNASTQRTSHLKRDILQSISCVFIMFSYKCSWTQQKPLWDTYTCTAMFSRKLLNNNNSTNNWNYSFTYLTLV